MWPYYCWGLKYTGIVMGGNVMLQEVTNLTLPLLGLKYMDILGNGGWGVILPYHFLGLKPKLVLVDKYCNNYPKIRNYHWCFLNSHYFWKHLCEGTLIVKHNLSHNSFLYLLLWNEYSCVIYISGVYQTLRKFSFIALLPHLKVGLPLTNPLLL